MMLHQGSPNSLSPGDDHLQVLAALAVPLLHGDTERSRRAGRGWHDARVVLYADHGRRAVGCRARPGRAGAQRRSWWVAPVSSPLLQLWSTMQPKSRWTKTIPVRACAALSQAPTQDILWASPMLQSKFLPLSIWS